MNKTLKLAVLAALGMAGPCVAQPSNAADAAAPAASDALATIIVTAEKRSEPLKDVPMSVTALSGDSLDAMQARSFGRLRRHVPACR